MTFSTATRDKTVKKKALITDSEGLVWEINNKEIAAVMDNDIWFKSNCRCS